MATIEKLRDAVSEGEVSSGRTRVLDVGARFGEDSEGRKAIFLDVTLTNPPAGEASWPVDEVWQVRRAIRDRILRADLDLEVPWFIFFQPEDGGDFEPGDTGDQLDV